ncbi:hypothetical protein JD969_04260 [Planctomycetota bacterium]|nr:hypothetical protein JD969_04260 [Planctomycetota bacterium]
MSLFSREKAMMFRDLAQLSYDAGLLAVAERQVEQAVDVCGDDPQVVLLQVEILLELGKHKDAKRVLDSLTELEIDITNSPRYLKAACLVHAGCEDIGGAVEVAECLSRMLPGDIGAMQMLAGLYIEAERFNDAGVVLRELLQRQAGNEGIKRLLGSLPLNKDLLASDVQTEADSLLMQYFMNAQREVVDEADASATMCEMSDRAIDMLRAARRCVEEERLADAERLYRTLIEQNQHDAELMLEAGRVACNLGEEEIALERFEKATEYGDEDGSNHGLAEQAKLHMQGGRFVSAIGGWIQIIRNDKKYWEAWCGVVVCGHVLSRHQLVNRGVGELKLHVPKVERRRMLAKMWHHIADAQMLQHELEMSWPCEKEVSPLDEMLEEASKTLTNMREKYPLRADVHYHCAATLEALGKVNIAKHAIDDALHINGRYEAAKQLSDRLDRVKEMRAA